MKNIMSISVVQSRGVEIKTKLMQNFYPRRKARSCPIAEQSESKCSCPMAGTFCAIYRLFSSS